jgi:hypothetical protein
MGNVRTGGSNFIGFQAGFSRKQEGANEFMKISLTLCQGFDIFIQSDSSGGPSRKSLTV